MPRRGSGAAAAAAASPSAAAGAPPPIAESAAGLPYATTPGWTREQQRRWRMTNEQFVDDVHLEAFYKPHSLLLMGATMLVLIYFAFSEDPDQTPLHGFHKGAAGVAFVFLSFSSVALPNGPFVRPHPVVWRCVLGSSILYWLLLVLMLFQRRETVMGAIQWVDGGVRHTLGVEESPEYAADCSFTMDNLLSRVDIFWIAHGLGWVVKALFLRSTWLCWWLSLTWEMTEILVAPILNNFYECWWDQLVFDVLICNGLGIMVGQWINRMLECKEYHWESVKEIASLRGKVRRAALQFTPHSWTSVRWEDVAGLKRIGALLALCSVAMLTELCTFFLKHVLEIPTKHRLNVIRMVLWGLLSLPATKQWYIYVRDPNCKRLGTQCWIAIGILTTELLICAKFGRELFDPVLFVVTFLQWAAGMSASIVAGVVSAEYARQWRLRRRAAAAPGRRAASLRGVAPR